MKALLIIWTLVTYHYGVSVSHTATLVETMAVCETAKQAAEKTTIQKQLDGAMMISIIATCAPL